MRKQNILDLLCDDYIKSHNLEEENFKNVIGSFETFDKDIITYIIPYIKKNYKLYDLNFNYNINSTDEIEKYKSLAFTVSIISGVCDLISIMPNYFKEYEREYDKQSAYEEICLRVLIGNILDIKKGLKNFKLNKSIKDFLDELKNMIEDI